VPRSTCHVRLQSLATCAVCSGRCSLARFSPCAVSRQPQSCSPVGRHRPPGRTLLWRPSWPLSTQGPRLSRPAPIGRCRDASLFPIRTRRKETSHRLTSTLPNACHPSSPTRARSHRQAPVRHWRLWRCRLAFMRRSPDQPCPIHPDPGAYKGGGGLTSCSPPRRPHFSSGKPPSSCALLLSVAPSVPSLLTPPPSLCAGLSESSCLRGSSRSQHCRRSFTRAPLKSCCIAVVLPPLVSKHASIDPSFFSL
jgi:hypothetical protein